MARRQPKTAEVTKLPKGVLVDDTKYPEWKAKGKQDRVVKTLGFLFSERFGWCVQTLAINPRQNRYYGMNEDGSTVTMGNPSSKIVHVYVRESRVKALQHWIDLHDKGMESAGGIRDRIGSRRAEGQVKRGMGLTSWRWDN